MMYFQNPKTKNCVKTAQPKTIKELKAAGWKKVTETIYYKWLKSELVFTMTTKP